MSFVLLLIVSLFLFSPAYPKNQFKLKPGAAGKICLTCHETFQEKLKSPSVHTPVKTGECSGCHDPHTSSHGKLLAADPNKICSGCHEGVAPEKALSLHKAVSEGNCVTCHDPHAAKNEFNLIKAGNKLCFDCHKGLGDTVAKAKYGHAPVEKGCLSCHDPHASATYDNLLKKDESSLCAACHKTNSPIFRKQHMNYPVADSRCTSCHDPHGSDKSVILFNNVHMPVANKMCKQCHEKPTSPAPLRTKKAGFELCRGCHNDMVNETLNKNRVHWPLFGEQGCLSCHSPHAAKQKGLLKGSMTDLCGSCHSDTIKRGERSQAKHEPVEKGDCTVCHSPHASDHIFLTTADSIIDLCRNCHDWQNHSMHPIGEKVVDQRNENLTVDCLSCHQSHGAEHKHMMHFATTTDLCIQCHKKFKR
jgi:predicted CXXCH cytochrome family protein